MPAKKSTEQTVSTSTVPVSTSTVPVSTSTVSSEKPKKSKKTVAPVESSTVSEESVVSSVPVSSEKPKKSKKTVTPVVSSTVSDESVVSSVPVPSEKPKKSKKTVTPVESQPQKQQQDQEQQSTGQQDQEQEHLQSNQETKKKRTPKKKSQTSESTVSSDTTTETESSELSEQSIVTEKRARKVVSQESLKSDVEHLRQQVEDEISRLRTSDQKNKGVKFLKVVNKSLKTLTSELNRVLKSKTKTTRNKNTSSGFMKPVKISSEMSLFTKWDPVQLYSRVDVTKYLCSYIKNNELQNPEDRRQIVCDEKLSSLLKLDKEIQSSITYPELQKHIQQHFITDVSYVAEELVHP
jgi:upstream activation factor subunit UAF30